MTADKGQTISRPSCLTVTATRFFVVFFILGAARPTTSAALFPQSVKSVRDMKPNLGLFVLLFYHILPRFSTKAAVHKPQQNRNLNRPNRNKPRILLPLQDILAPFGFGMVGELLGLSKARSNFDHVGNGSLPQNSCASLCGQTFDRLRFALPVLVAPKGTNVPKMYRSRWGFVMVRFGYYRGTVRPPCLLFPAVKVYNGGKKFWRYQF